MKKVILALVFAVTTFALVGCGGAATTAPAGTKAK